ncbi:hypothetical protein [Kibdelosporangium phytohabitans]|uniref:Uncharacterized protein n=1 Tax=Kibdelosporangium phytohabitans TaxID=860235 RepID=A0A0N9HXI9_9PSEU|nr:hypothetical protein [Kibdelosporangium phytohabitans]ALG08212.1 hypothetical protein AOZ06_16000 [Kibdelosporangium phytohabitans]MBE1470786.1 hypothetical protein [Kibdelosporangium phytohabitans]
MTAKDGIRRVYAPVLSAGTDLVFQWGLGQTIDVKANTVTYNWLSITSIGSLLASVGTGRADIGSPVSDRPAWVVLLSVG